jgi:hypothetical protein
MFRWLLAAVWLTINLTPAPVSAHAFGTQYILPIPLWMYVYGCAATLIVTFMVLGIFARGPTLFRFDRGTQKARGRPIRGSLIRAVLWLLRAGAAGLLLLTVIAGLIGSDEPDRNIGMTLFWAFFLLGFAYLTLFLGDLYALINPWKLTIQGLQLAGFDLSKKRIKYPQHLGYWPAFVFYVALVWVELFIGQSPITLSILLLTYTAITLAGSWLFSRATWFQQADIFSVFFRMIGMLAPVEYISNCDESSWQVRLRLPFSGLIAEKPQHLSLVLFVLFMLSSTSYDGIHDTELWISIFWRNLMVILQPLWGNDLGKAQRILMNWFNAYQQAGLLVFPFIYLGIYLLALLWAKLVTRSVISLRVMTLDFCYSLIPIAFAYNFTHYYPFLLTQVRNVSSYIDDPFGLGWRLLKLRKSFNRPALEMDYIWHTQVAVILIGHVASVVLAHNVATRIFSTRREIIIAQLPLLLLMVIYTMVGLWILSLSLQ